jgi:DNA-binding transcriptional LysR family regulator
MITVDQLIRRLSLRDIRIFLTVVERGSLARAANNLSVSRPVVSKSIANLERTLGVRLLDRSPQGIAPTRYGHALMRRGTAMLDELRQSVMEIRHLTDPGSGELRIGASEYMAAGLISFVIDRLSRRFPALQFQVELAAAIEHLRERKVELVVTRLLSPQIDPDLEAEVLFHERVYVAAGPTNKYAGRRKVTLAELMAEPWILAPPEIVEGSPIVEAFRALGHALPPATVLGLSLPLRNGLLATGRFLTIVPGSVLQFGAERILLKALPVDVPDWHLPVAVLTLRNRSLTPLANMFIDEVRGVAKAMSHRSQARKPGSRRAKPAVPECAPRDRPVPRSP